MTDLRLKVEEIVREVVREYLSDRSLEQNSRSRPLVAANWKMNHLSSDARSFARRLKRAEGVDMVICPPLILLHLLREAFSQTNQPDIYLGAQDLHHEKKGAFTGEHSAEMILDAGATHVIIGHSERRQYFNESCDLISRKLNAAITNKLCPILCVGENMEDRSSGATFRVLSSQLSGALAGIGSPLPHPSSIIMAYEPVWAIGTGLTASPSQANEAIEFIRDKIADKFGWNFAEGIRLLYGGSVNKENAAELAAKPEIDGFLVGGASLCADNLSSIARHAAEAFIAAGKKK